MNNRKDYPLGASVDEVYVWRGCTSKKRFYSLGRAHIVAKITGPGLKVYRCKLTMPPHYHIGHPGPKKG